MKLLSFDTSSGPISVCLMESGNAVLEKAKSFSTSDRQEAIGQLMPIIDQAVKEAGWKKSAIDCLVVGVGPGSFTSIRTAVVTARTLAQALKLPLVGVSLLECYASLAPMPSGIAIDAGRGNYFIASYDKTDKLRLAPQFCTATELEDKYDVYGPWYVDAHFSSSLGEREFRKLPDVKNVALLQTHLAWNRVSLLSPGQLKDQFRYEQIEPLYLKGVSVTVKKTTV